MKLLQRLVPLLFFFATSSVAAFSVPRQSFERALVRSRHISSNQQQLTTATTVGTSRRPTSSYRSGVSLSMHMGHSHSHHHHHNNDGTTTTAKQQLLTPQQKSQRRRRRIAMFCFAALAIFGQPTLIKKRALNNADIAAFLLSSTVIASADKIRQQFRGIITKFTSFKDGIVKHSSPEMSMNPMSYLGSSNSDNTADDNDTTTTMSSLSSSGDASREADRVTVLGVIVNLVLSLGKFFVGITCHSNALVADAGHSLSDLFSDFVTLYSVQLARLPPDDDHPYGHGKFEAIGSLFLALTLIGTGISVGAMANKELLKIYSASRVAAATQTTSVILLPKPPALLMAGISIVSKEWLYRITKRVGDKLNSQVVIANAWHHRSDAYSSVLALLSIGLAIAVPGMVWADAMAGILVAGMIGMTGIDILSESIQQLSDTTSAEWIQKVETIVQDEVMGADEDVIDVTRIRARPAGSLFLVDVRITTPSTLSTSATRAVEERVRRHLLQRLQGQVIDAEVHATPETSLTTIPSSSIKSSSSSGLLDGKPPNMMGGVNGNGDSSRNTNNKKTTIKNVDGTVVCPLLVEQQDSRNTLTPTTMNEEDDDDHNHNHDHDHTEQQPMESVLNMPPSASEMQREVRQIALLLQRNHHHDPTQKLEDQPSTVQPYAVESVTVHYEDAMTIVVDVDLSILPPSSSSSSSSKPSVSSSSETSATTTTIRPTLAMAQGYSNHLKQSLEEYYYSNAATVNYQVQAKVFLDLTSSVSTTASPVRKDKDDNDNSENSRKEEIIPTIKDETTTTTTTTPTIIPNPVMATTTTTTKAAISSKNTTATTTSTTVMRS